MYIYISNLKYVCLTPFINSCVCIYISIYLFFHIYINILWQRPVGQCAVGAQLWRAGCAMPAPPCPRRRPLLPLLDPRSSSSSSSNSSSSSSSTRRSRSPLRRRSVSSSSSEPSVVSATLARRLRTAQLAARLLAGLQARLAARLAARRAARQAARRAARLAARQAARQAARLGC